MGHRIWIVGLIATLLFVAAAVSGYRVTDTGESAEGLSLHLILALVAGLLMVFTHGWIGLYLALTARLIGRSVLGASLEPELSRRARRAIGQALPLLLPALIGTVALVSVGIGVYTGRLDPVVHQGLAWGVLAVQLAAVVLEKRILDRHEALVGEVDRLVSGA